MSWGASKVLDGLVGLPSVDFLIISVSLCIGFLQQHHPKFSLFAVAKCRMFASGGHRDVSIKLNKSPSPVNADPDKKIAVFCIVVLKQPLNKVLILSQCSQRAQEVAVPQSALFDIIRRYAVFEELWAFVELLIVFPLKQTHIWDL